ncbi:MAG: AtpZ/AtpI family protein [bacterium]
MKKSYTDRLAEERDILGKTIDAKVARKLNARRRSEPKVWLGLGMMGLVGWSVATPTLLGVALGLWLDKNVSSKHSWTLALLATGLVIGCFNAWTWVKKENKAMNDEEKKRDE